MAHFLWAGLEGTNGFVFGPLSGGFSIDFSVCDRSSYAWPCMQILHFVATTKPLESDWCLDMANVTSESLLKTLSMKQSGSAPFLGNVATNCFPPCLESFGTIAQNTISGNKILRRNPLSSGLSRTSADWHDQRALNLVAALAKCMMFELLCLYIHGGACLNVSPTPWLLSSWNTPKSVWSGIVSWKA